MAGLYKAPVTLFKAIAKNNEIKQVSSFKFISIISKSIAFGHLQRKHMKYGKDIQYRIV
jgi:hypothetical protein